MVSPLLGAAFATDKKPKLCVYEGEPQAQCARSATIWASGRTRDPYFEILGAPRGIMVTPSGGFARCMWHLLGLAVHIDTPEYVTMFLCYYPPKLA